MNIFLSLAADDFMIQRKRTLWPNIMEHRQMIRPRPLSRKKDTNIELSIDDLHKILANQVELKAFFLETASIYASEYKLLMNQFSRLLCAMATSRQL